MLVIIWHLLADPVTHFRALGADHFTRAVNTEVRKRTYVRQLEALGWRSGHRAEPRDSWRFGESGAIVRRRKVRPCPSWGGQEVPMDLPLLLAGPILRRVDPNMCAVWLALSKTATVTLKVWEGQLTSRDAGEASQAFVSSNPEQTWRLGEELHLIVITARIPVASGKSFTPDTTYCYDLAIQPAGADATDKPFTLKTLNMLDAVSAENSPDGFEHVALGYEPDLLPSFAPPPSELTDLRLLYGSCRLPDHPDPDALAFIDDYLLDLRRYKDPRARPHQLFLGGDQIYADFVHTLHMLMVMDLGQQFIGRDQAGKPVEQIDTGHILDRKPGVTTLPPIPREAYTGTDADVAKQPVPAQSRLPADRDHFPEGYRLDLTQRAAQLTSTDGENHIISIGEFAALYLSVWSNAVWPKEIPLARRQQFPDDPLTVPLHWTDQLASTETIRLPDLVAAERVPLHLFHLPETEQEQAKATRTPDQVKADERKDQRKLRFHLKIHADFLAGLARVRRVLANVPTYMILDDHDATDDYFLNPVWRSRVLDSNLGQNVLRSSMLTYALFQDWGNDPIRYDSGVRAELLTLTTNTFPHGQQGPAPTVCDRLGVLFGHNLRNGLNAAGQYDGVDPPITWHFTIDGPKHRVIALDNRTRRSYPTDLGPPGNVSPLAQEDQIPKLPLPAGIELLVVIAPLQVIGPPILDDLVAPLSYRLSDLAGLKKDSPLNPNSPTGMRAMTGTDPDAIEAWATDAVTFEHLLRKLADYRQVVLLSGDVHNSSGTEMSYWRKDDVDPSRIVQFTSSGFKNVMPAKIAAVDRSAGFAQQMIRAGFGTERIGWLRTEDDLVLLPAEATVFDVSLSTRKRLRTEPVMIPTWGWPNGPPDVDGNPPPATGTSRLNPDHPPDWRWRTKPILDERLDGDRPEAIRPLVLDDAEIDRLLSAKDTKVQAFQKIAARHQSSLGKLRNARQILFRANFGLLHLEREQDGTLTAVNEIYTAFKDPQDPDPPARPTPAAYLLQRASLGPVHEAAPTQLRTKVLPPPKPAVD